MKDTCFVGTMVHGALEVTILAAAVQSIGELEGNHVAIVAIVLRDFFLPMATTSFRSIFGILFPITDCKYTTFW